MTGFDHLLKAHRLRTVADKLAADFDALRVEFAGQPQALAIIEDLETHSEGIAAEFREMADRLERGL